MAVLTGRRAPEDRPTTSTTRVNWPLLALALLALLGAFGARRVVPLGTMNADEGVYASQAQLLRTGDVTLPTSTHEPFFRPWLTGERDGRIFFQYEPGWPAVLALGETLFGSMLAAGALTAMALVLAVHALAVEALGSRRTALIAAALTALCPLFLLHSALYLSYTFTTLLATVTLWCAFRAVRTTAAPWAIGTGAGLGAMLLTRPFDAVLTGVAVVAVGLLAAPGDRRRVVRLPLVVGAAALPFVVLALLFNLATTGSPTTFPLPASDPRNRFGFGQRRMQIGTELLDYPLEGALRSLGRNLIAVPSWIVGGFVALALAAWSALQPEERSARFVLVLHFALFPLGYTFWWATGLSAGTALNGLGPNYYVPSFVAVIVLSADGLARISRLNRTATVAVVLAMVAVTAVNLPDKFAANRAPNDRLREIDRALADPPDDSLIFVRADAPTRWTIFRYPILLNPPRLDGPVLYPVDLGNENARLIRAHPDRDPFLLHREVGWDDHLLEPDWTLTPLTVRTGDTMPLSVSITPRADLEGLEAFASSDTDRIERPVAAGHTTAFEVELTTDDAATGDALLIGRETEEVVVGLHRTETGERWQRRYEVLVEPDGTIALTAPGTGEHVVDFGQGPVTIVKDVDPVVADAS